MSQAKFVTGARTRSFDGRFSDLVGLITFAGYADGDTPPTLDHAFLVSQLNNSQIVTSRNEDGTAIGDAISLAVEKLNALDARQKQKVKSKVIILLTDGENNAGQLEPVQAAELAQTMGIKIYTIGVGTKGQAPVPVTDPFRKEVAQWMQVNIDEATLEKVASVTGGKYFRATDTESLEKIYERNRQAGKDQGRSPPLCRLSASWQFSPTRPARMTVPPLLLIAFVLLAARLLLQQTWLRELA